MATASTSVSERGKARRVIVVGGGVAGLMTVIKLCEAGVPVLLLSPVPSVRSHSLCARDGIDACLHPAVDGDGAAAHLQETILGGDFLAHQPPVRGMTEAAPDIVYLLDRMGVPFNRTPEGRVGVRP